MHLNNLHFYKTMIVTLSAVVIAFAFLLAPKVSVPSSKQTQDAQVTEFSGSYLDIADVKVDTVGYLTTDLKADKVAVRYEVSKVTGPRQFCIRAKDLDHTSWKKANCYVPRNGAWILTKGNQTSANGAWFLFKKIYGLETDNKEPVEDAIKIVMEAQKNVVS